MYLRLLIYQYDFISAFWFAKMRLYVWLRIAPALKIQYQDRLYAFRQF